MRVRVQLHIVFLIMLTMMTANGFDYYVSPPRRIKRLPMNIGQDAATADTADGEDFKSGATEHSEQSNERHCDSGHCNDDNDENERRPHPLVNGNQKLRGTCIAVKAAEEAKQANDEMSNAVKVAAHKVRLNYADRAASAARAAELALEAKQRVLEQLRYEIREAEVVAQEEFASLGAAEATAGLANTASEQAKGQLKLIRDALALAKKNVGTTEEVSAAGQQSLNDKLSMVRTARNRVDILLHQLGEARAEYSKTRKAACEAATAAHQAHQRVERLRRASGPSGHIEYARRHE